MAAHANHANNVAGRAEPLELDPALGSDAALQHIGLACLDHISSNEAAVLVGAEEGIHQMRVAVRRLRATLSAFRKQVPENQRQWASAELRWLADALGPARNLEVFETALLQPVQEDIEEPDALEELRQAARRRRRAAYRAAAAAVRSARCTALLRHLYRWFEDCGWREGNGSARQPIGVVAEHALRRRWRIAKKHSKDFTTQSPDQRHRLRIALKKLRYTAESLATLYPAEKAEPFIKRVKRLQDDLGHANDVRVGHDILAALVSPVGRQRAIAEAGQRVLGWHEHRLAKSEPKLRRHLHELFDTERFWRR